MDDLNSLEYMNSSLETLLRVRSSYVPKVGNKIFIDDTAYEVTDVEAYYYTANCKQNKIRVFVEHSKE